MDDLNQKETRKKIIALRGGMTKKEAARRADVAYNYYIGIESGKNKITMHYVRILAEGYGVDVNDIAVFNNEYSKGYFDGLSSISESIIDEFNEISKEGALFEHDIELGDGKIRGHFLSIILSRLGYSLKLVDTNNCFLNCSKEESEYLISRYASYKGNIFALFHKDQFSCYWSILDYCNFEDYIYAAISGYIQELINSFINKGLDYIDFKKERQILSNYNVVEMKKRVEYIGDLLCQFECAIERGDKNAKSERDGDDLQAKG